MQFSRGGTDESGGGEKTNLVSLRSVLDFAEVLILVDPSSPCSAASWEVYTQFFSFYSSNCSYFQSCVFIVANGIIVVLNVLYSKRQLLLFLKTNSISLINVPFVKINFPPNLSISEFKDSVLLPSAAFATAFFFLHSDTVEFTSLQPLFRKTALVFFF